MTQRGARHMACLPHSMFKEEPASTPRLRAAHGAKCFNKLTPTSRPPRLLQNLALATHSLLLIPLGLVSLT